MNQTVLGRRQFSVGMGAVALGGFGLARAQGEGRIVLGQSAAFTGPAAQLGVQFNQGAKLFFDQLNAQGGVGKRMVEIRTMDDGYEPDRCAENTRKLIADEVFALFGYIGTPTSLAALPLFTKEKVPFFGPFTGAEALRQPFNRLIFHVRASYYDETALIVRQLTNLGLKKIAVFYQNDAYGKAGLDGVTRALAELKLAPVATATVERNSTDVKAAVDKLVPATPDAVVQIAAYAGSAAFVRAARKAGFGGTFYNVSFVGTQALADELGKDGAGVVVSQVVPSPYQPSRQITREFLEAIKKGGDKVQPNYSSMEGYLAARVFTEGLRQAQASGKITRESFITGTESIGNQVISGFPVSFSATSHAASKFVEMSMLTGDGRVRT
ncbi:ABC-type branched-subunit amino acid transport system substrate-binding protein [Acidovorax delafieldii]|uniref:ABC-type branched-subunit amino acid transport system substrate-binding protein n=1 Tax=Acidovorax delafieldii TaxID=47920 RepID=A0AAJ2BNI7_ACIDE|nr:ABC transporter substrate-binding protein [Acidovorax delafieldii]MDR6765529.1 ABC-type branched-subunit amino acid transport system substrate-binding protein [Acidovorax delafieldii]MDR6835967.1 ABC-type branched-subunit amino acid transport system substrate-binding protein [Acidovorax delafieldii]MDR7365063.1 ABC-type branched-subunit amino acid transport system substrate-binding protein [Acidovorax delafieldii]